MIRRKDGFSGERALVLPQFIIHEMEEDPISSILHITDIGYYPKAWHHFRERQEPITQFVFIYCIEGSGWFRTEDQVYPVTANQYFILPTEPMRKTRGPSTGFTLKENWPPISPASVPTR